MGTHLRVWIGSIPSIHGYGMMVVGKDRATCEQSLRARLHKYIEETIKTWGTFEDAPKYLTDLEEAIDYFGGNIREVEPGWVYNDNFG